MNNKKNARICVAGLGGVGGIIGGALAKTYPHVSFLARGARLNSIRKNGLIIKSEFIGDFQIRPEKLGRQYGLELPVTQLFYDRLKSR